MSAYSDLIAAGTPFGYWRLGESSGTSAADASGNSRTGTYSGTPTLGATGAIAADADKAVTFDGTDDIVTLPDLSLAEGTADFTYEALAKWTTTTASLYLVSEGRSSTNTPLAGLRTQSSGRVVFGVINDAAASGSATSAGITVNDGAWHHIVGVRRSGTLEIWVDAVLRGTVASPAAPITLDRAAIGALRRVGNLSFFPGTLDEVAVYSRALSAQEIADRWALAAALNVFVDEAGVLVPKRVYYVESGLTLTEKTMEIA